MISTGAELSSVPLVSSIARPGGNATGLGSFATARRAVPRGRGPRASHLEHRRGFDFQLPQYDSRGWRATFYTTGMEHSPTSATGTGWERTPWHATQRAAWETLKKASDGD